MPNNCKFLLVSWSGFSNQTAISLSYQRKEFEYSGNTVRRHKVKYNQPTWAF